MAVNIVVVGSLNMDMIVQAERIPRPGETILGGEVNKASGGKGANQAAAAARLGGQVLLVGRVGRDENGEQIVRGLQEDGVDTAFVVKHPTAHTGLALITVDSNGQNTIVVSPGANWYLKPDDVNEALNVIRRADMLLLQLEIPLETVEFCADYAHRHGVKVVLNPAPAHQLNDALLQNVDYLIMNEIEATVISSEVIKNEDSMQRAAAELHQRGTDVVVITLGKNGAFYSSTEGAGRVPAFQVKPVDSTGAGDAFVAAFAVAIGGGRPLEEVVRFASAAGALATLKKGARPSLPYLQEVDAMLKQSDGQRG